jgi:hypothetical protein
MPCQSEADAGFYALVNEVLQAEQQHYRGDRRDEIRQPYECRQLIAPFPEGSPPSAAEFRKVRCLNLSPNGMRYLDDSPPQCLRLIVLLGAAPFTVLTAEVVHQTAAEGADQNLFLIGCRFTGRLKDER